MFICQIIASRGDGGLEKHVRDLSQALVEQGHRVLVIGDDSFVKTLTAQVEYIALDMRLSRYHPKLLFQLYQHLRKYCFDVVHAQANKATSMLSSVGWLLKTPTVATLHNMKSQVKLYQRFSNVICVSQCLARQVNHAGVEVIYNGIQNPLSTVEMISTSLHEQFQLPKNKPVICAVGRLVPAKGFDVLLEAANGLDISVIIIGEGPNRALLEQQAALMQTGTIVRIIGHHDNPVALMQAADGLVISSLREGFSYVLNEALVSGVNVLSTDVPVANEVLPEALIVPIADAAMLRSRLQTLLSAPKYWAGLMQEAHQFSKTELTLEQMTKKTANLYQRMSKKVKQ